MKIVRLSADHSFKPFDCGESDLNEFLDFIKQTFITNNRTGCCFVTVDALHSAVSFYESNGFRALRKDNKGDTVPMYYDLKQLL